MDDSNLQGELQRSQGNLAAAVANVEKLRNGNRDEEIATAQAQLAEQDANLQKLRNGNRSQELAETQAMLNMRCAKPMMICNEIKHFILKVPYPFRA